MLCVVRDKAEQLGLSGRLLLLRQDLLKLDLYGTIRGAVSTFDTFNHIPDLDTAIANEMCIRDRCVRRSGRSPSRP